MTFFVTGFEVALPDVLFLLPLGIDGANGGKSPFKDTPLMRSDFLGVCQVALTESNSLLVSRTLFLSDVLFRDLVKAAMDRALVTFTVSVPCRKCWDFHEDEFWDFSSVTSLWLPEEFTVEHPGGAFSPTSSFICSIFELEIDTLEAFGEVSSESWRCDTLVDSASV